MPSFTQSQSDFSSLSYPQQLDYINHILKPNGLRHRGVCKLDHIQVFNKQSASHIVLIGHYGSEHWPHFTSWLTAQPDQNIADPLDTWSKSVIFDLAQKIGGQGLFPSDKPYLPFQRWAQGAQALPQSPINLLIHPDYGTWHGYRGALALNFGVEPDVEPEKFENVCLTCVDKPCLTACPVDAFADRTVGNGFNYTSCQSFLKTDNGQSSCMEEGCLARNGCPFGLSYTYKSPHMTFHMRAFNKYYTLLTSKPEVHDLI
jgi:hypothetical protein